MANAFLHSQASKIDVEISYERAGVRLTVRDNGRGMERAILDHGREGHWGLPGMRERARKIGAVLALDSRPGGGTRVELRIPAKVAFLSDERPSLWERLKRAVNPRI